MANGSSKSLIKNTPANDRYDPDADQCYTDAMLLKIVVGSTNPVKSEAVKEAFAQVFPDADLDLSAHKADSGVPDQPFGNQETRAGAFNRAKAAQQADPDVDYAVGLEGGLEIIDDEYWAMAWMCVLHQEGRVGYGRTGSFILPQPVADLIGSGLELAHATDQIFATHNSGQQNGTVGFLTSDLITRKDFYVEAMIFALIPFLKNDLYQ